MKEINPKVDVFLEKAKQWQEEMKLLRSLVLECNLVEDYKWMHPCYTYQESNIVLIHIFKDYVALLFIQGALIKDTKGILVQQTENVQAARQIRFTSAKEIAKMKPIIKAYIKEAIEVEKVGLKVELKKTTEFKMPEEFKKALKEMPEL